MQPCGPLLVGPDVPISMRMRERNLMFWSFLMLHAMAKGATFTCRISMQPLGRSRIAKLQAPIGTYTHTLLLCNEAGFLQAPRVHPLRGTTFVQPRTFFDDWSGCGLSTGKAERPTTCPEGCVPEGFTEELWDLRDGSVVQLL